MANIKNIIELRKGVWVASYEAPSPCGCSYVRKTVVINQKSRPVESTIQKAIKNDTKQ